MKGTMTWVKLLIITLISFTTIQSETTAYAQMDYQTLHERHNWGIQNLYTPWKDKVIEKYGDDGWNHISDAFQLYTATGYQDVNQYLRQHDGKILSEDFPSAEVENCIDQMDKGFNVAHLPLPCKVYRRTTEGAFGWEKDSLINEDGQVNLENFEEFKDEFSGQSSRMDHGYMSTSVMRDVAISFTQLPILMEISVPEQFKGVYVAPLSFTKSELELLLNRNSNYTVNNIKIQEYPNGMGQYIFVQAILHDKQRDFISFRSKRKINSVNDKHPLLSK
ncbi:ADP-ribosyltransferase [Bacillus cereus]|uniref:ADP-ribosyltransferase n=1 Tax=Bacillus cereus TaxID=1396 RepID=UPI003980D230